MATSARRLYRLAVGLGAVGIAGAVLALVAALSSLTFAPPSLGALAAACRRLFPLDSGLAGLLVLTLASVGLVALGLALRSLVGQLAAHRRFRRELATLGTAEIAGVEFGLVADKRPKAFCTGFLRPRIYLSTAALERLSKAELEAVLSHERHHLLRRDPLRILLVRVLADALFFLPAVRRLAKRYDALAELAADEAAVRAKDASSLASALLAFRESASPQAGAGIAPERVDHLLGRRASWELPGSLVACSLLAILGLTAASLLARTTAGTDLSLPALFAESCMLAMAAAPFALLVAALRLSRARAGSRLR